MRHTNIQGWFNHERAYQYLLDNTPENGTIVELGAWLGKSSSYLCEKSIGQEIVIVDTWKGSPNELTTFHKLATETDIFPIFQENMKGLSYTAMQMTSEEAVKHFDDETLDAVFIDLTHTYEAVKEDIQLWMPKVKKGGIISGDDYHPNWAGVMKAVDELIPDRFIIQDAWLYEKTH
jgi:predicted O-methyltransferase YrrM